MDLSELVQLKRVAFGTGPRPRQFMDTELPVPACSVLPPPLHPMQGPRSEEVIGYG